MIRKINGLLMMIVLFGVGTLLSPTISAQSRIEHHLSPDGQWLALFNRTTGRLDLYIEHHLSPDGQWLALFNRTTGRLDLYQEVIGGNRPEYLIFSDGSGIEKIEWSPNSRHLLIVRRKEMFFLRQSTEPFADHLPERPLEIWEVNVESSSMAPTVLFQAAETELNSKIIFEQWSPDSRYLIVSLLSKEKSILLLDMELESYRHLDSSEAIQFPELESLSEITVTGQVITGSGDRRPISNLPLWIGNDSRVSTYTDEKGYFTFTLTNPQADLIRVRNSHLSFNVPVSESLNLGLLKYPLIHPPNFYYWSPIPPPDLSLVLEQGRSVDFTICYENSSWRPPSEAEQQTMIWSKPPFKNRSQEWLTWWFERPAILYNSEAQFSQSYPDGPNLDPLTVDWRYLLGLWTDEAFEFRQNDGGQLIPHTACSYDGQTLDDLLFRRQLEVWLMGYRAIKIQQLDKNAVGYDESEICSPRDRSCDKRPAHQFILWVEPTLGYQMIRFPGVEDVLAIHMMDGTQQTLLMLPQIQPYRWRQ